MQDSYYTPADSTCSPVTNYISRMMPAKTMELIMMGQEVIELQRSIYMNNCILNYMLQQQQATLMMDQE